MDEFKELSPDYKDVEEDEENPMGSFLDASNVEKTELLYNRKHEKSQMNPILLEDSRVGRQQLYN